MVASTGPETTTTTTTTSINPTRRTMLVAAAAATAAVLLRAGGAAAASTTAAATTTTSSSSATTTLRHAHAAFLLPFASTTGTGGNLQRHRRLFQGGVRALSAAGAKGRPSLDDVERISRGQAAKKRGVGSRAVCHRLNEMERKEFDLAKKLGFVQLRGTGYRRERKGSPLANIHRQLCDAMARPCVEIHRGLGTDAIDEVVVDLSPLRPIGPGELDAAFEVCRALEAEFLPGVGDAAEGEGVLARWEEVRASFEEEDWETRAIWDLPVLAYYYDCTGDRALAKKVAQEAHARLGKLPRKR